MTPRTPSGRSSGRPASGPGSEHWQRNLVLGIAGAAAGAAVAGGAAAAEVARRRRVVSKRGAGDVAVPGSLRSPALTVVADDGVPLHVEVDEFEPSEGAAGRSEPPLTVVWVHGYALTSDCWHFQRAAYRGLVRSVFYDQRSHGRSGRSSPENATIEQCAHDLLTVLDEVATGTPVVLVGHSMGGMTIAALAEEHPELFGTRIVGVGLVATAADKLDMGRMFLPAVPARLGGELTRRVMRGVGAGHKAVDLVRDLGGTLSEQTAKYFAFGRDVPRAYLDFAWSMLSTTPTRVLVDFFPSLDGLDKLHAVEVMGHVPVSIVCGTKDRLTKISHSRTLHARISGSRLLEVAGAGHLVMIESHGQVNAEIDQLLAAATETVEGA
ncbi:alpha/beta fold hydrolase [Nocardioides bruguierae]|uniref:alpha/beta fold hydrolase n=1 Tax=Nocardioides bruguierae TaxID=2945102 RepID=UPI0020224CD8|nr:alpha/beta hydrolase [Nocardioides bruguierae]MCL8027231.1 alpha/beta hydrolase [Nocardioides bruguierae]